MAWLKTDEEIESMRKGGKILSDSLGVAARMVKPGITLKELDTAAEEYMRSQGAEPSFLHYRVSKGDDPFPSTVCVSVNDEIVHGSGDRDVALKEGDIVGLDIGCWFEGLCTDMAVTVPVGKVSKEAYELIEVTRQSCLDGVDALVPGGNIAAVGTAVEKAIEPYGYGNVRQLVGHGVGHEVHEAPQVPNYYRKENEKIRVEKGMCLAIEPMITLGGWQVDTAEDGWSVIVADGSLGAHFEMTVAITDKGMEILTPWPEY